MRQVIATDHAVFNTTQKRRGRHDFRHIPNGVNGIEERLHIVWEELVNAGAFPTTCCSGACSRPPVGIPHGTAVLVLFVKVSA